MNPHTRPFPFCTGCNRLVPAVVWLPKMRRIRYWMLNDYPEKTWDETDALCAECAR